MWKGRGGRGAIRAARAETSARTLVKHLANCSMCSSSRYRKKGVFFKYETFWASVSWDGPGDTEVQLPMCWRSAP